MSGRIRVLYVDDEPDLLELGKVFLEATAGFTVDTLTSAGDALANIPQKQYDAIISDYQMPEMDGIALLKAIRAAANPVPFILFTGRGREEVVIEAINNGADFYLQKGGEPKAQFAELAHKVRQSVVRRKAQEELRAAYEQITAAEEELRSQYNELVVSERRIQESEDRFRRVIQFSPLGMHFYAINKEGALIFNGANPAADRLLGIDHSRFTGTEILEVFPALKETGIPDQYQKIAREGGIWHSDQVMYDDGSIRGAFSVHAFQIRPGAIVTVFSDITDQKRAEEALRRSEERYRSVVNDQTMMIARFTPDGTITFVNDAYHAYYAPRLRLDKVTGRTFREIMQVQNYDAVEKFLALLTEDLPVRDMEREITGADGNNYWQIWTVKAIFDKDHRITEYQVIGRDITDRKRAEDALRQSEERFRAMVDQSPFSIIVFAPDGTAIHANDAHCRFWGITMDKVLGYNVFRDPQMERLGLLPAFRRAFAGEQLTVPPIEYNLGATLGSGQKKMVQGDFYPIRDEKGSVMNVIIVHQDLSEKPQ